MQKLIKTTKLNCLNNQKRLFSSSLNILNNQSKSNLVEFTELQKGQVWLIDNLFSQEECQSFIAKAEEQGFNDAPVTVGVNKFKLMKDYRNNKRVILDDRQLANQIYAKVQDFIPELATQLNVNSRRINTEFFQKCGVNERFRFYKYSSDEYFKAHFDGNFARNNVEGTLNGESVMFEESSFITMLIYLNTVEKGGQTNIINTTGEQYGKILHSISPKTGRVLLFVHRLLHEAVPIEGEQFKYVLRTDVMYRRPMSLFSW